MSIKGTLSTLAATLNTDQYKLCKGVLSFNIGESIDDLHPNSDSKSDQKNDGKDDEVTQVSHFLFCGFLLIILFFTLLLWYLSSSGKLQLANYEGDL